MSKHYCYCRVLSLVLLFNCGTAGAQPNQNDRFQRSNIVKIASYAPASVSSPLESSGNSLSTTGATTKLYAADILNADWKTQSGSFTCLLTHHIEGFGNAVFARKTGSGEVFYLKPQAAALFPQGVVSMDTLPPAWRSEQQPIHLGRIDSNAGELPVKLSPANFAPVLTQLLADAKVMFTASSASQSSNSAAVTRVVVDPKNFATAYKTYQQCLGVLIPYTFAQVSYLMLHYFEKAEGVNEANKAELNKVARYVNADPEVLGILIDAHSDNAGSPEENEEISKQETEWIAAYLVLQGVNSDKITARWHGDKFPIGDNKTAAGRDKNRRVTVRLENETTRKVAEQKAAIRLAAAEKAEKKLAEEEAAKAKLAEQTPGTINETDAPAIQPLQQVAQHPVEPAQQTVSDDTATVKPTEGDIGALSKRKKITPEQISKMVDGLDLIPKR